MFMKCVNEREEPEGHEICYNTDFLLYERGSGRKAVMCRSYR